MKINACTRQIIAKSISAAVVLLLAVSFGVTAKPSNKWRIEMDGRARVDGEIELSFTPNGGSATNVVIAVPKGTSENAAARLVRDRIKETFGRDIYHVETDDGEDVLVKIRGRTPHFDLVVICSTAEGLHVGLHRE